jgi:hypothetical protein
LVLKKYCKCANVAGVVLIPSGGKDFHSYKKVWELYLKNYTQNKIDINASILITLDKCASISGGALITSGDNGIKHFLSVIYRFS